MLILEYGLSIGIDSECVNASNMEVRFGHEAEYADDVSCGRRSLAGWRGSSREGGGGGA
jgi:hypothetical protein